MFLWASTQAVIRERLQRDLAIGCAAANVSVEDRSLLSTAVARSVDRSYRPWIVVADAFLLKDARTVGRLLDGLRADPSADLTEAVEDLLHGELD